MGTYFLGSSEIQAAAPSDGIQTLYLMNPNYLSSYSDDSQNQQQQQQQPPNMFFFNPTSTGGGGLNPANLHHHVPPPNHHLVGIPLPGAASSVPSTNPENQSRSPSLHGVIPGIQYNIWGPMDQNSVVSVAAASGSSGAGAHDIVSAQMGFRRPTVVSPGRQGLSLSLSSQQAQASAPYNNRPISNEHEIQALHPHVSAMSSAGGDDMRVSGTSPTSVSAVSNGVSGVQSVVLGSKYLRATQELLDEVVNVGKSLNSDMIRGTKEKTKTNKESTSLEGTGGGETSNKRGPELTTAQRQELQMKKAKLVNMLDEVEQRYRQYYHQMQLVVSSFEQAAGFGAAKSYTALALQTISKQFRCLKDAIADQIKATSKSLGDEDCLGARIEGSRLRFVDHQLRQQRALQQIGMIQHNAWRPQRGLPERAVSVLRAWLFEHFLHPYPKDSDKHMLAKQTGLTRSQVSNWFINARVRLWKPMVEEMYMEEIKDQEKNTSEEKTSQNENKDSGSTNPSALGESSTSRIKMDRLTGFESKSTQQNASTTDHQFSNANVSMSSNIGGGLQHQAGFTLIRSPEMEALAQRSVKKQRNGDLQNSPSSILSMDMEMKQGETGREITVSFGGERLTKDGYPLLTSATNHGGTAFGTYPMGDLAARINADQLTPRYGGNAVSLTLGLPHNENLSLPVPQQSYLSNQNIQLGRRLEMGGGDHDFQGIDTQQNSHSRTGFDSIDIQSRKRFPAQLLPDFVG